MQMVGSSYDGNYIELYIFDSTHQQKHSQCYVSRREPWKTKST